MNIEPVGIVKSSIEKPVLVDREDGIELEETVAEVIARHHAQRDRISEIVIEEKWQDLLDGIEDFSHLVVLFWAHHVAEERRTLTKVHPMGVKDNPLTGIFATRSPARPNPVLMTVVHLLERAGNVLKVTGLDAVDGSPVIDIKPYTGERISSRDLCVPAWMEGILQKTAPQE
jgi:tRNA-Thr(GGU) m(6)t(6)A37 methyltransferase TsaA